MMLQHNQDTKYFDCVAKQENHFYVFATLLHPVLILKKIFDSGNHIVNADGFHAIMILVAHATPCIGASASGFMIDIDSWSKFPYAINLKRCRPKKHYCRSALPNGHVCINAVICDYKSTILDDV